MQGSSESAVSVSRLLIPLRPARKSGPLRRRCPRQKDNSAAGRQKTRRKPADPPKASCRTAPWSNPGRDRRTCPADPRRRGFRATVSEGKLHIGFKSTVPRGFPSGPQGAPHPAKPSCCRGRGFPLGALRRILSFRGRSPALRGKLRNAPPSVPSARSAAPGAPAGQAGDGYLAFAGRRIEGRAASPHSSAACPGCRLLPFAKWPRWALPHAGMRRRRRSRGGPALFQLKRFSLSLQVPWEIRHLNLRACQCDGGHSSRPRNLKPSPTNRYPSGIPAICNQISDTIVACCF